MASQGENGTYTNVSNPPKGSASKPSIKPTVLAIHGSGSNGLCHQVQLARLLRILKNDFNFEYVQGPFPSSAGPGILPYFEGCGPFKRWLPPGKEVSDEVMRQGTSTSAMAPEVENVLREAVHKIRSNGGKVVGLLGFSQGTKVVAGLLKGCEIRRALGIQDEDWLDFDFAVSICASYPPPLIPPTITSLIPEDKATVREEKISIPTFHVIGQQDQWNWASKGMIEKHYDVNEGKSVVVEWDMGHIHPAQPEENQMIGEWMVDVMERSEGGTAAQ